MTSEQLFLISEDVLQSACWEFWAYKVWKMVKIQNQDIETIRKHNATSGSQKRMQITTSCLPGLSRLRGTVQTSCVLHTRVKMFPVRREKNLWVFKLGFCQVSKEVFENPQASNREERRRGNYVITHAAGESEKVSRGMTSCLKPLKHLQTKTVSVCHWPSLRHVMVIKI